MAAKEFGIKLKVVSVDRDDIEKVLKETYLKLEGLHDYLEKDLQTL